MKPGLVVVAYESASRLPALLASVEREEPEAAVVVVDSGSPSGPPHMTDRVALLALDDNVGFGAASNRGAGLLPPDVDVLAFVNPDVRLAGPSLTELGTALTERPSVGIATGPVISPDGARAASAWGPTSALRAFWFGTGWNVAALRRLLGHAFRRGATTSGASLSVDDMTVEGHVLGGAMIVRRECWEQLGGFDEDFFLYWEDADLCHRARQLGWEIRVLPCTPIIHEAGTSSEGVLDEQRWQWYVEGAETFARKHLADRERRRLLTALRWGRKLRR